MIQFSFSPKVSIQLESTEVYLEFGSCLNTTTTPQSSLFSLPQSTEYFQRKASMSYKGLSNTTLEACRAESHPCYQWGHLNLLAHTLTFTEVQLCAANHTHKTTWNQPSPGEEPRTAKSLSHAWARECKWSKKRKEKGADLLLRTKRELTRTRLKTVHIMEIQEMHH